MSAPDITELAPSLLTVLESIEQNGCAPYDPRIMHLESALLQFVPPPPEPPPIDTAEL